MTDGSRARTIFIRGVAPRSGTNYLRDLVLLHPDVGSARRPVWEDFVLDDAHLLSEYADRLVARWPDSWAVDRTLLRQQLLGSLGRAAADVLVGQSATVVAAKTPYTRGLHLFPDLFPDDVLVVLVRDGRSVVESLRRSFGWSFERAVQEWAGSAARIREFMAENDATKDRSWTLVRYEEALETPAAVIDRVAVLAGLTAGLVDEETATGLPVRGSSDLGASAEGVHWRPVQRDESFQPGRRWQDWDERMHRRFNWVAGESMSALGYELEGSSPTRLQTPGHRVQDLAAVAQAGSRRVKQRAARLLSTKRG